MADGHGQGKSKGSGPPPAEQGYFIGTAVSLRGAGIALFVEELDSFPARRGFLVPLCLDWRRLTGGILPGGRRTFRRLAPHARQSRQVTNSADGKSS